jgi:hypothetical protein
LINGPARRLTHLADGGNQNGGQNTDPANSGYKDRRKNDPEGFVAFLAGDW